MALKSKAKTAAKPAAATAAKAETPKADAATAADVKKAEPAAVKTEAPKAAPAPAAAKAETKKAAPAKKAAKAPAKKAAPAKTAAAKAPAKAAKKEKAPSKLKSLLKPKAKPAKAAEKTDFDSIMADLKSKTANYDASGYQGFLAIQVTLTDLNRNLYVEIKDGRLAIEPYEYNDHQANIIISSTNFVKMINGKLNSVLAYTTGKLKVERDLGKAQELSKLFGK